MARLPLTVILATMLLLPASAAAHKPIRRPTTDPVALSLRLAERYWHGTPACGTPTIVMSAHQLPNSEYETVTSPEPKNSVVEMWTEVQKCRITINASLWPSWHQDDESFQWFCDAMTHEVGHLFGHLDSGQTNARSITYPFLDATSPNFDSVPECHVLTGNRTGDPELRATPAGTSVCSLRLASTGRRKDAASGERVDVPNYFNVTVWGRQGETAARQLCEGRARGG